MRWTAWGTGPGRLAIAIELEEVDGRVRVLSFTPFDGIRRVSGSCRTLTEAFQLGNEFLRQEAAKLDEEHSTDLDESDLLTPK